MLRRSLIVVLITALGSLPASGQSRTDVQDTRPGVPSEKSAPGIGSPEEEIIRRAQIKHAEESHKEMVERADEAAVIGEQILSSYKKNKTLGTDDLKKLERLEKLARKIRGSVGGSNNEEDLQDRPAQLEPAVTRLAELSGFLKKSVQKTSRLVISAGVIKGSNELIQLIRHIRNLKKQ